ncbi:sister chromatid cohesion 1 protein 3-like [Raphanus sativus]|uniref:Sister chromatid cohesion 1 protein 3-like n=1 Tax=Raphanus sativus TaxID=3726 RepID=A0A6J0LLR8_RAPSA|nr:sister chromatid cohesion 1 protein 3-like [Raphanus sativus]
MSEEGELMFYSQEYLARKGPLGTVWSAAHLQNRLKKSHYTATNIPETVDFIMYLETPLAPRLSGHLLLGVVRIYSKQVDYVVRDCTLFTTWLAKSLVSTRVDLPEDARQAPVESVTLPQALNLDDFDLEDDDHTLEGFDNHLRSQEDITLTDQIPTGIDPYVAVTFDDDIFPESTPMDVDQPTEPVSAHHPGDTDVEMAYESEPYNNDQGDFNFGLDNAYSPGSVPEVEIRRDVAAHGLSPASHPPFAAQQHNVRVEEGTGTLNEKEPTFPNFDEEMLHSRGHSTFELRSGSPRFAGSEEEHENFVHPSPQLVLQPTPPPPPQPQVRARKRNHFDKVTVLTNRIMKERIEDPSDTLRKRKKMPSSKLNVWRMNNQSKKDQIFNEPLLTGCSDVLRSVFDKDCVASKPHLAAVSNVTLPEPAPASSPIREAETEVMVPDSTNQDSTVQLSPVRQHEDSVPREAQSPPQFNNDDNGMERLREGGYTDYMPSPPPPRFSPSRTDDFTTQTRVWETESYRTEPSTSTYREDLPGPTNSGVSDIPEMVDEELYFLEVGGNTPVRSPASQDSDALTDRTRALAQYLKERSSSSPTSSNSSGDLSLGKILDGKTRKVAARMFFETLVLKSRGLIDMQQDQPYSDITLKLMPGLF